MLKWDKYVTVLQVIVSPDGGNGSNLEHSAADAVAAAQINEYMMDVMYVCMYVCMLHVYM